MYVQFPIQAVAVVTASANGPAVVPTFVWSQGIIQASSTHTAAGVYAFALEQEADAADCAMFATALAASTDTNLTIANTSDSVKTVTVSIAGAASDVPSFAFMVLRRPST